MQDLSIDKQLINNILEFTKKCDNDFSENKFSSELANIARNYLDILNKIDKKSRPNIINALSKKLESIINKIDSFNYHDYRIETVLNLASLSVTDYIISLVREKCLVDPLLITRYVYIELSKVLYYDISYVNQDKEHQKIICDAQVDLKREKIFSYVVCTQYIALYKYILSVFNIEVEIKTIPGNFHVWGEIRLDDEIVIVDATDYINGSIDLSNAKANSPTVGYVLFPKKYSGIRIYDIFHSPQYKDLASQMNSYYDLNRELDMTLGYITKKGYKTEQIIRENDLFHHSSEVISDSKEFASYLDRTADFFKNVKIPNNMDGYEIFAYYQKFARALPKNVLANIYQKTLYVEAYKYKLNKMRKKFLHIPNEYLKYLQKIIYNRYYKYLSEAEYNVFLEQIKEGTLAVSELSSLIANCEMTIADINCKLNLFYAINMLQIFDPFNGDIKSIQLYEPMMGTKTFDNAEDFDEFKRKLI